MLFFFDLYAYFYLLANLQNDAYPCAKLTEGHFEVVELLLNHGANIKAKDKVQCVYSTCTH
jgi:hypothetical protein